MDSARRLGRLVVVSTIAAALLVSVTPANATTITPTVFTDDTTNNGNCTLREAVIAANTNLPRDMCLPGSGASTDTIALAE